MTVRVAENTSGVNKDQVNTPAVESQIKFHKTASIFPLMAEGELTDLAVDIKKNGLLEPIRTYRGEVIDGRNRYLACYKVGVEPQFKTWDGRGNLLSFIISMNLKRRHLNESQRAMIAARLANMPEGRPEKTASYEAVSQSEAAKMLNVSRPSVQRAVKVQEKATPAQIKSIETGEKTVTEVLRQVSKPKLRSTPALPKGIYDVIYADPPWCYEFSETKGREIENKYQTMSLNDICDLKIPMADNAVLFLWATAPKLEEALQVLNAWRFSYRTCAVWNKEVIGMGYWFRGQHELLLVGVRGNFPRPQSSERVSSVITERRGKHSQKPDLVYDMIENMCPGRHYLELFSRSKRNGWTMWGLEA